MRDADYYEMIPNACRRELLHNQGRFYMTPVLPYPIDTLPDGTTVLTVDDIGSTEAVQNLFDEAYPVPSTGSAWVVRIGENLYINNSHENTDTAQDFSIDLDGLGTFTGTLQPHSYVVAKIESKRIWLMGNAGGKGPYTDDRTTHLELTLEAEPTVSGGAQSEWVNGTLRLSLDQSAGAVEATIQLP